MLDTRFPRPLGDVGHPGSWAMPVGFEVVRDATPRRVVQQDDSALLAPFIAAGKRLVAHGARALTTSCGFLVRHQAALQAALPVPVWTSSLLLNFITWCSNAPTFRLMPPPSRPRPGALFTI